MKKILYIAIASAFVLSSCSEDLNMFGNNEENGAPVFTGRIENLSTRTSIARADDHFNVNWVEGDQITVSNGTAVAIYKAKTGGATTTEFAKASWGSFTGESYTAYYPKDLVDGILPSTQTYAPDNVVDVPMIATSTTTDFSFSNICGIIRLDISTSVENVKVKEIKVKADQGLSGTFSLSNGVAVVEGTDGVKLDCGEGVALGTTAVPFYISVPANTYTGLSICVVTTDGREAAIKLADNTSYKVQRSQLCAITLNATAFAEHQFGKAVLMSGPEYACLIKRLADPAARTYTVNSTFKKVVFKTNCNEVGTTRVDAPESEEPVYATFDSATSDLVISTPASEIYAGENASYLFAYLSAVTDIENIAALNTSDVKYFNNMFCFEGTTSSLKSLDLSHFNTSNGITFKGMFLNLPFKSIDVSSFDTSKARVLSYMFASMLNLETIDLSNFNTSNVFSFSFMFNNCQSLKSIDLRNFDTSNAEDFDNMFSYCYVANPIDISSFKTPKAYYMRSMFNRCKAVETLDFSGFSNEELMFMQYMFQYCEKLKGANFDKFKTPKVRNMSYIFRYCSALEELDLREWDLSHVTTLSYAFQYCTSLKKIDLSGPKCNTESLTAASYFINASNLVTLMKFGKDFNCRKVTMSDGFYQAASPTYLKATKDKPQLVYATAEFAQASLRGSANIRTNTNKGTVKWISIYDEKTELVMSEPAGSITASVVVTDPAQPVIINATI